MRKSRIARILAYIPVFALALTGCTPPAATTSNQPLQVVASTPILADLAQTVGGSRAHVTSLVPPGANPHSYEPSLRDIRDIAYAHVALTNGLLLEQNKLIRTIDANLPEPVEAVPVAEHISQYGGQLQRIVEDASLDSLWLGVRIEGGHAGEPVHLNTTKMVGPGQSASFITETFGAVDTVSDSHSSQATRKDLNGQEVSTGALGSVELPAQAHTHLSWSFAKPGLYEITVQAADHQGKTTQEQVVRFAVGVDSAQLAQKLGSEVKVLDAGHADITANIDTGKISLRTDSHENIEYLDPDKTLIEVPTRTLQEIPSGSHYRFLHNDTGQVYLLAQAVLGKHVHGDTDPHFWHSIPNVQAAVSVIRDVMSAADPQGATEYARNASEYVKELSKGHQKLQEIYGALNESERNIITTHDGYRYLADTYQLKVAGFVTPAAGSEPSAQQRARLRRTIEDLNVPALYLERGILQRTSVLAEVASDTGTRVCELYSDTLDDQAPHYLDMMLANANMIRTCSSGK